MGGNGSRFRQRRSSIVQWEEHSRHIVFGFTVRKSDEPIGFVYLSYLFVGSVQRQSVDADVFPHKKAALQHVFDQECTKAWIRQIFVACDGAKVNRWNVTLFISFLSFFRHPGLKCHQGEAIETQRFFLPVLARHKNSLRI